MIAQDCAMSRVSKALDAFERGALAMLGRASMQGVGTESGTVIAAA